MLNDCRKKLVPVLRGEGGRWVHNRHNLNFLAVSEEISPGLHPVPVRSPKVVSLESTLRKVVVQATTPDYDNVRTECFKNLKESRLGVTEILL